MTDNTEAMELWREALDAGQMPHCSEENCPLCQAAAAIIAAKLAEYRARIEGLEGERDEADRRAGAAERLNARLEDDARKHRLWLAEAKKQAGFGCNTSFDVVWAQALDALTARQALEADHGA